MAGLILEPYAVSQRWKLPQETGQWEARLAEYLETLARRCSAAGPCVVGHIKALALFPESGYVQVSVVGPALPASVQGRVPAGCTELVLDLNVIVYGLARDRAEQITRETAARLAAEWQGEVMTEATRAGPQSPIGPHTTHTHQEREQSHE